MHSLGVYFYITLLLLNEYIELDNKVHFQVVVFCTTAMVTEFTFIMLRDLRMNVREIHSRKPQLYRSRTSDEFRESSRLILITSDVTARGVNYPDVTLVIQVKPCKIAFKICCLISLAYILILFYCLLSNWVIFLLVFYFYFYGIHCTNNCNFHCC
jgi:Helicase conserved C-terminal domain